MKKEQLTMEQAMDQLEVIVSRLDAGDLTLDESLRLYEEGIALARQCEKKLSRVRLRVDKLAQEEADGEDND